MTNYVVINLAEAGIGVTNKVKVMLEERVTNQHRGVARAKAKKKKDIEKASTLKVDTDKFIQKYDLVGGANGFDQTKAGFWFGLGIDRLIALRRDCLNADIVYLCAHGSATDRGQVFAEKHGGRPEVIATVGQLGDFVEMVLDPSHQKGYEVVCVICFAARSNNPDARHEKAFLSDPAVLKTSLAYKLFKQLTDAGIKLRMSARVGEAKVQYGYPDLVTQTEDAVKAGIDQAEFVRQEVELGKTISEQRKDDLRKGQEPRGEAERKWQAAQKEAQRLDREKRMAHVDSSKGLLFYQRSGTTLTISFEGESIYTGPML